MMSIAAFFVAVLVQAASGSQPFRPIDQGTQSNISTARQVTVRDKEAWAALWRTHSSTRPLPEVDFTREMVLGLFLGTRPTAGFTVEIVGVRVSGENVTVEYRETAPARGDITAQVLVSPYHFVAVPIKSGSVTFERK